MTGTALLACLWFPFGLYFIVDGFRGRLRAREAVSWPVFDGEILSSDVGATITSGFVNYWPRVNYRYNVNGQSLESDSVQVTGERYFSKPAARAVAERYAVGTKVKVHVDPQHVMTAVLDTGGDASRRRIVFGLATLAAPLVLGLYLAWLNTLR